MTIFYVHVRCMLSPVRLLSVSIRSCALLSRLKFSAMFLRHLVPWPSIDTHGKILRRSSQGNPPSGRVVKRKGVAKYIDFGPIEGYISETVQDRK